MSATSFPVSVGSLLLALVAGCGENPATSAPDLANESQLIDDGGYRQFEYNLCGEDVESPCCEFSKFGPAQGGSFPLRQDAMPDPNEDDQGLRRDSMGFVTLAGIGNLGRRIGRYSYVVRGCPYEPPRDVLWYAAGWEADVPHSTRLAFRARTGKTPIPDKTWGPWSLTFPTPPADLRTNMPLMPFDRDNSYLQAEFTFTSEGQRYTPRLKSFTVAFKCPGPG